MVMVKELSLVAIGAVTLLLILVGSSSDAEGAMYMKLRKMKKAHMPKM